MSPLEIHPDFNRFTSRAEKEKALGQRSKVLWLTGLSGSGKSTLASALEQRLFSQGYFIQVLDGDNVRSGICNNLGFSMEDRKENIRRIAELSRLLCQSGIICINSFVSPTKEIRSMANEIIGAEDFIEIYVNASLSVCEKRDVKGLYKKARSGEIPDFTGIGSPYEVPIEPDIEVKTDHKKIDQCLDEILQNIIPLIQWNKR